MSALGQKRTSEHLQSMSALPPNSGHWNSVVECPLCAKSGHTVCGTLGCEQTTYNLDVSRSGANRDWAWRRIGALIAPKPRYPRRSTISIKNRSLKLGV